MTNEELYAAISQRFDRIDERLSNIEERLDGIEEDTDITRQGVNAILDWADIAGRTINVRLVE